MAIEALAQLGAVAGSGRMTGKYHDVGGGSRNALAKRFAGQAFDAITVDGAACGFFRDRKPEARVLERVCTREHCEVPIG